jgi:nickel-type superoxide dismutase maturation protease
MLSIIKVSGESLNPAIYEGDFVLIAKIPFVLNSLKKGDVVVFNHPDYGRLIKRIEWVSADGEAFFVVGTHDFSVDSRQFGPVSKRMLLGKVIWHIPKPRR